MAGNVTGFGGVFFRSKDPDALKTWYKTHFGIDAGEFWAQAQGNAVLGVFKSSTDYFAPGKQWMMNFRVDDLAAISARLEAEGISIRKDDDWDMPGIGKFARVTDPEGNEIELWEPAPEAM